MKTFTLMTAAFGVAYGIESCSVMYANQTEPFEQFGYFSKGELLGCRDIDMGSRKVHTGLGVRDEEYDTNMAYSDKTIQIKTLSNLPSVAPHTPQMFNKIFARINEACTSIDCDTTVSICEPAVEPPGSMAPNVCASFQGSFTDTDMRGNFVNIIQTAHKAGITSTVNNKGSPAEVTFDNGSSRVAVVTTKGDYSGYTMAVKFTLEYDNSNCPSVIQTVNSVLASTPAIGDVFGLINAVCSAIN